MSRLPTRARLRTPCALGATLAALALITACSPPPRPRDTGPAPLCLLPTPGRGGAVRELRTEQWHELLVRGHDARTGQTAGDALRDCTGATVRWQDPSPERCPDAERASDSAAPPHPLSDDDVVIGRAPGGQRLVWLIVERFDDGEGVGPVAQVEFTSRGAAVRRIGILRARTGRPRLRIERAGETTLLVAEGERCTTPDDPSTCRRTARVLVGQGPRFANVPLTSARTGECVGPALFHLARESEQPLASGWQRRFELNTTLNFEHGTLDVHEQVVVRDSDPRIPAMPPRVFRRVDADRSISAAGGVLAVTNTGLWRRVLLDAADVGPRSSGAGESATGVASGAAAGQGGAPR